MSEPTRKLVAIAFTDIVGFTELSSRNEPAALDLLENQRNILKPIVQSYNGQWLKEIGDGLLLIFDGTLDAVKCCIDIQEAAKGIDNLDLRIGIHQGEVVYKDGDVIGDDVNIASRAEPFSEPGGIVVTDRVNASLMRNPAYKTKLIGKPSLKGVRQDISLFCIISHNLPETDISRVAAKLEESDKTTGLPEGVDSIQKKTTQPSTSKMPMILGGAIVGLVIIAGLFYSSSLKDKISPSISNEKESIAVLPFINMSSDKENEYFSDGITEEILNYLAKIKDLRVISRTSVFTYKGRTDIGIADIGHQLNVSHVLEGSVRKAGNKVRITSQLIRTKDDAHLWSETYDRELENIFALQDEIARTIVNTLKMDYITHTDIPVSPKKETSIKAFNSYIKGRQFWNQRSEKGLKKAIKYFKQTLSEDPEYDLAYTGIATSYGLMADYGYMVRDEALSLAMINLEKAQEIDPNTAELNTALAYINWMDNKDKSVIESYFKKAIKINPNYSTANHWLSDFLGNVERDFSQAVQYAEKAYRLDPVSPIIIGNLANAYMRAGMFEKAEQTLTESLEIHPDFFRSNSFLSLVYRRTGRWDEAEKIIYEFLQRNPKEFQGWYEYASILVGRGKYSKGIESVKEIYELVSPDNPVGLEFNSLINFFGQDQDKASELAREALSISPGVPIGNLIKGCIDGLNGDVINSDKAFNKAYDRFKGLWMDYECMTLGYQAIIHAINNDKSGAESIIEKMINAGPAPERDNFIGMTFIYLGDKQKGWDLLSKNMERNGCYLFLKCDPFILKYKNDPQYQRLLAKYNLN